MVEVNETSRNPHNKHGKNRLLTVGSSEGSQRQNSQPNAAAQEVRTPSHRQVCKGGAWVSMCNCCITPPLLLDLSSAEMLLGPGRPFFLSN